MQGQFLNRAQLVSVQFDLVWFYGISTIVGYLMPIPVYADILNMICKHIL